MYVMLRYELVKPKCDYSVVKCLILRRCVLIDNVSNAFNSTELTITILLELKTKLCQYYLQIPLPTLNK